MKFGLKAQENPMSSKDVLVSIEDIVPITKMEVLEIEMQKAADKEEVICPLRHHFSNGVYMREVTMPTGSCILGHKHTTAHLNILSQGICIIADVEEGKEIELRAPCTFESDIGAQKFFIIVEECVFSTIHATDETDIDKLEEMLFEPSRICKLTRTKDKYIGGR